MTDDVASYMLMLGFRKSTFSSFDSEFLVTNITILPEATDLSLFGSLSFVWPLFNFS
jgi:urate oxidase